MFKKRNKGILDKEKQEIVRDRAYKILEENYGMYFVDIITIDGVITLDDVIDFCDEYGVTLDYIFGRSDTPYHTL